MTREFALSRFEPIADIVERWALLLIPVSLASVTFMADVLCSLIAILFVVRVLIRQDFTWIRQPWLAVLLAMWLYLCLRSLVSVEPGRSFVFAIIWLRFPIFAVAISRPLRDPALRRLLLLVTAWSVLLLACDAIVQYVFSYDIIGRHIEPDRRLTGPFNRPRVGIGIAWMFLPPLIGLVDLRRRWFAAALGIASLMAILLSGERMAFLTIGLDAVFLALLLPSWRRRILIAGAIAVGVFLLVLLVQPALFDRQILSLWRNLMAIGQTDYGQLWIRALAMVAEHPLFGVGMHNYRVVCPDPMFGPDTAPNGFPRCSTHPHNFYIEWLVAGGIPVLVTFIAATLLLLRDLLRGRALRDGLFIALVVTMMMRLWYLTASTSFFLAWSAVPLFFYIGWALSYLPQGRPARRIPAQPEAAPDLKAFPVRSAS